MASLRSLFGILLLCSNFFISCHANFQHPGALFIFGDSVFDSGNNNYINTTTATQSHFLPYGETFFKYPTGRFSDGRLIPDFIGKIIHLFVLLFGLHKDIHLLSTGALYYLSLVNPLFFG
ncbi:hypothetical protein HHK36_005944 [Tetracentron sinense]|uniref:Uncharacterized protein n=1 Tax=Tetracentron sinense TaxID=13715 RepID=A0A834ZKC3_TETSI|nr:hypothetical protein HHK36_005944 [Tetracentron sinense]